MGGDQGWRWRAAIVAVAFTVATPALAPASTAAASPAGRPGTPVSVVVTRPDLTAALTQMPTAYLRSGSSGEQLPTIRVDPSIRYQQVQSFGAAMTDSSAWLIGTKLPRRQRGAVMQDLFSTRSGIGLRFLRVPVGASDFTVTGHPYTYDDLPAGRTDPSLTDFSIAHDLAYIIPTLRQAVAIDPRLELLATPWTAPPWMKANDSYGNPSANGLLDPGFYGSYAEYLVKFLQAYRAQGVRVGALTVQNEPDAPTFPGGELPPQQEADFIGGYLEPALRRAGLGATKLYGLDNGNRNLAYALQLLHGPAARQLAGIAWHCYGGLSGMSGLHGVAPGIDQIVSECSPGIIPYSPAEAIIDAVRNWASTAALWNVALSPAGGPVHHPNWSCRGCSGLLSVSEQRHTFSLGLGYYELGQVSKYVEPGAVRIGSTRLVRDFVDGNRNGVTPGVDDVAFRNPDGALVLVAHDNGPSSRFRLSFKQRSLVYPLQSGETATFIWR